MLRRIRRATAAGAACAIALAGAVALPEVAEAAAGKNLSLVANGGVATASGTEVSDGRWTVAMGADGDDGTRWSSNYSDNAWYQVQLAQPSVVDHVNIKWEAACAATYKLQVSNDGTTWTDATDVITPTCGTTDTQELNAATAGQTHGYVRMQALSRTAIGGSWRQPVRVRGVGRRRDRPGRL